MEISTIVKRKSPESVMLAHLYGLEMVAEAASLHAVLLNGKNRKKLDDVGRLQGFLVRMLVQTSLFYCVLQNNHSFAKLDITSLCLFISCYHTDVLLFGCAHYAAGIVYSS